MKSKFITFVLICIIAHLLQAQERIEFIKEFKEFSLNPIVLNGKTFYQVDMGEELIKSTNLGQANLPCYNRVISYPTNVDIKITETILEKDTIYIDDNIKIVPLQKSKLKKDTIYNFYFDKKYYQCNSFQEEKHATIHNIGIAGQENLSVLSISPLRYNPVKNIIERVKKIKIEVDFANKNYAKSLSATILANLNCPYKLLILTDESFKETLKPFVSWKIMQGFEVTQLYISEIGQTKESIKSYLQSLFDNSTKLNPFFDYLLIVGDTDIIPTFSGKYKIDNYPLHNTDLYYAEYTGDILPDVFYGRISAKDTHTLKNIIDKTIKYEQCKLDNVDYLKNSLLIAGKESGDNAPTFTNGQINYLKKYFCTLTDTSVYYNPSSNDDSNRIKIKDRLNLGNAWVNYSGHGLENGWQLPPFRIKDIDTCLNNNGKYGVFINNCCLTGKYGDNVCFAEALLQAENKGAVACISSSDYTLWDEDYYWSVGYKNVSINPKYSAKNLGLYDRLFHTHNENFVNRYITMGQIVQAGCLAVSQSLSDYSRHYWEMYNLQGDPTLIPYIGLPKEITNNIPDTIVLGTQKLEVNTLPYTYFALSQEDTLIAALHADSMGYISMDLTNITTPKVCKVVLTNQFYKPLIDSIVFVSPQSSFIALKHISITDKNTGDTVDNLEVSKEYFINLDIVNSGLEDMPSASYKIELITQNNLLITQNNLLITHLNSLQTHNIPYAFKFSVKDGVDNLDLSELIFVIYKDDTEIYRKKIIKEIFAPELSVSSTVMQQSNDTIYISVNLINQGRIQSCEGNVFITDLSDAISVEKNNFSVKTLDVNEKDFKTFKLIKHQSNIEDISFTIKYEAGNYNVSKEYFISLKPQIEDFEKGFSVFLWQNDEDNPWFIDTLTCYKGHKSARSKKNLADNRKSRLKLIVNNQVSSQVSFYAKVSSEQDYDNFKFYIDDKEKMSISFGYNEFGMEQPWKKYVFDVPSGQHSLCFSYEKDQSFSYENDCAWIDEVVLSAGSDSIILSLEALLKDDFIIYPNPTQDVIYLDNLPNECDVIIFDNNQRVIYKKDKVYKKDVIDISKFENGIYYVALKENNRKILSKKFIKLK